MKREFFDKFKVRSGITANLFFSKVLLTAQTKVHIDKTNVLKKSLKSTQRYSKVLKVFNQSIVVLIMRRRMIFITSIILTTPILTFAQ